MRTWISAARRSLTMAAAATCVGLALAVPAVTVTASTAHAALAPVAGCGFHFGPISEQGAAGTLFFSVVVPPANPAQRCTTSITFTATATPSSTAAHYTTIDANPLTATQTVAFAPGRLAPVLTIAWQGFHCADPAVPGLLTFAAGGQSASIGIDPSSCFAATGGTHSNFASFPIPATPSAVGIARTPSDHGYRTVSQTGALTPEGDATAFAAAPSHSPVVGITSTPSGHGYWLTASDGGVFAFGDATFAGSMGSVLLNAPIVGIAAGPHGGYWLVGSDGSIFSFGGVPFEGSLGAAHLNAPVCGMAATSSGNGYWLVGADNGIFAFGDAHFFGSSPSFP